MYIHRLKIANGFGTFSSRTLKEHFKFFFSYTKKKSESKEMIHPVLRNCAANICCYRPQVRYLDDLYTLRNVPGDVQFLHADHPTDNMRPGLERITRIREQ